MKRVLKALADRLLTTGLIEGYFRARATWPIWYYFSNRKPKRAFKAHQPALDEAQQKLVRDLNEYGIATTHIDDLFPGRNFAASLSQYTNKLAEQPAIKRSGDKPFLRYLWDAVPKIDYQNPFAKLALQPRLLAIINSYLGLHGQFYYATLNITSPMNEASKIGSQRWHRDPEDKKLCKVFLYLNDIDESAGPFQYVMKSKSGSRYGDFSRQRPPYGAYPDSRRLEKVVAPTDIKICTGRAGTLVFCDTSGLHCGGYALSKERLMFTGGYRSAASMMRASVAYPKDFLAELAASGAGPEVLDAVKPHTPSRLSAFLFRVYNKRMYAGGEFMMN